MSFTANSTGGKYKHQHQYGLLHGEYYGLVSNTISVLNTNENGDSEWVPTHSESYQAQSTFKTLSSQAKVKVNVGGTMKTGKVFVNVNRQMKKVKKIYVNVNGQAKEDV